MTIVSHGQEFEAHVCPVCGARDTSERDLARHTMRHWITSAFLAGELKARPISARHGWRYDMEPAQHCNVSGCVEVAATHGMCKQHNQLRYSRRKAGIE